MVARKTRDLRNFACGCPTRCTNLCHGQELFFRWLLLSHAMTKLLFPTIGEPSLDCRRTTLVCHCPPRHMPLIYRLSTRRTRLRAPRACILRSNVSVRQVTTHCEVDIAIKSGKALLPRAFPSPAQLALSFHGAGADEPTRNGRWLAQSCGVDKPSQARFFFRGGSHAVALWKMMDVKLVPCQLRTGRDVSVRSPSFPLLFQRASL